MNVSFQACPWCCLDAGDWDGRAAVRPQSQAVGRVLTSTMNRALSKLRGVASDGLPVSAPLYSHVSPGLESKRTTFARLPATNAHGGNEIQPARCSWPRPGRRREAAWSTSQHPAGSTGARARRLRGLCSSRPASSRPQWQVQRQAGGDFPVLAGRHSCGPEFGRSGASFCLLPEGNM